MRILQIHNFYQYPGGEDQVCAIEYDLLTRRGHSVIKVSKHNDELNRISAPTAALRTVWNNETYRQVRHLLRQVKPDVVHAHNIFPLISPALYYAASAEAVPTIQTLHNYRLICPAATLFRDGGICEDCVGAAVPVSSVVHRCYRRSWPASAVAAAMLATHRAVGTWFKRIDTYIALTPFARNKFIEGGLPPNRIVVKPNCLIDDPGIGTGNGGYALFAGRLIEEKGINTLLAVWQNDPSLPLLKIVGQGDLASYVEEAANRSNNITFLGQQDRAEVLRLMQRAMFLVFPSRYYEGLPMTIIEALSCGTPVIASDLGSMQALVVEHVNGLKFEPGNAEDLSRKVHALLDAPGELDGMRRSARESFERNYTAEQNYKLLMDIYETTIANRRAA